ncbi:MAG TPA: hypothetical protein VJO32_17925, partial [Ktedonobacteraceae bacterium]|nr:hypothetical protein [Ktedonobacteraceae bacterium]
MRQGDGSDLLGAHDARGASIGIIYVAPTDDRSSVLEAILMQDKLGRKQVAVVLPESSRAFQRPVDFDGLKNMRRGLKTEIIFVAPGVPGPAEFARQRRFTVYTSLESYTTALRAESPDSGNAKKGLALFGRKPKLVPNANAPAPLEDLSDVRPSQPVPAPPVLPVEAVTDPLPASSFSSEDGDEKRQHEPLPIDPFIALGGAGMVGASLATDDNWLPTPSTLPEDIGNGSHTPSVQGNESAKPVSQRPRSEPIPIPFPMPSPQPKIT